MIHTSDIYLALLFSLIYLFILPIQLVIFPMQYYSIKDVIYSRSWKKATKALVSRFCFIFLICLLARLLVDKNSCSAIYGITMGSFLCAWPSIYHYQLFVFYKNNKLTYFVGCLTSIFFSWACATFSQSILLPMIFDNKSFYLLDNNGINILLSILGMSGPVGIGKLMKKDDQDNPYLVSDTFSADLYLTKRKMIFQKEFINSYKYEIENSATKYGINPYLLETIVRLEIANRYTFFNRTIEHLAVRFIPNIIIRMNASIGLAQIKISNAQKYFHRAPQLFLPEMLKPEISIDLCAYMLKSIIDKYTDYNPHEDIEMEGFYDDDDLSDDYKMSVYLASKYLCGDNLVLQKYVMVYATIINETSPATTHGLI